MSKKFADLVKNSNEAFVSAIEIHNNINLTYRYNIVSILLINAWELLLKAFINKYNKEINNFYRSHKNKIGIFKKDEKNKNETISFDDALNYVSDYVIQENKEFLAVKENLLKVHEFRNKAIHFYHEDIDPYMFSLCAKTFLNYNIFLSNYFHKDLLKKYSLPILPIGFQLPINPIEFLQKRYDKTVKLSEETKEFIDLIMLSSKKLKENNISDSIIINFSIYCNNSKNMNSDITAMISNEEPDAIFKKEVKCQIGEGKGLQKIMLSEEQIIEKYPYAYKDILNRCKEEIKVFKKNIFDQVKKELWKDQKYCYVRYHNLKNKKENNKTVHYAEAAFNKIKLEYDKKIKDNT